MSFADLIETADDAALEHLGEAVIYQPAAGAAVEVTGIFDTQHVLAKGSPEAGVAVVGLAVFLRLEDLPVDPEDDEPTLTIRGVEYFVPGAPEKDGLGGVVLPLRAVA